MKWQTVKEITRKLTEEGYLEDNVVRGISLKHATPKGAAGNGSEAVAGVAVEPQRGKG